MLKMHQVTKDNQKIFGFKIIKVLPERREEKSLRLVFS